MDQFKEELEAKKARSTDLNLLQTLESHITEIVQIEKEIKRKFPKLFYQRLPRFMRRRAASHNVKRVPKSNRPHNIEKTKDRKKLFAHRRKVRYLKRKRILRKHQRHSYKDKNKTLLHKWFAKRFKIERPKADSDKPSPLEQVPLHNNTKNQRNLYRQTRYGCAYLSMAHLVAIRVELASGGLTFDELNKLTDSTSGFTFSARALEKDRYEVVIHLFDLVDQCKERQQPVINGKKRQKLCEKSKAIKVKSNYICPCYVSNKKTHLILWVPREHVEHVISRHEKSSDLKMDKISPCDCIRIRLIGPKARIEAMKLVSKQNLDKHKEAIVDVDRRLMPSGDFGLTIGRNVEESDAISFTYYPTEPLAVDIVFRKKAGRMLWHQLVKNKAHLVGGKRDVDVLLEGDDCFYKSLRLIPDNLRTSLPQLVKPNK